MQLDHGLYVFDLWVPPESSTRISQRFSSAYVNTIIVIHLGTERPILIISELSNVRRRQERRSSYWAVVPNGEIPTQSYTSDLSESKVQCPLEQHNFMSVPSKKSRNMQYSKHATENTAHFSITKVQQIYAP